MDLTKVIDLYDIDNRKQVWKKQPEEWVKDRLGGFVWKKQVEIMKSVVDNPKTLVVSCHASGKTFTAAAMGCWWIDTHPLGDALFISTAPTWRQVESILWREIAKQHNKGSLPGKINAGAEWKIANNMPIGYGRKPADTDQSTFQGIHERYVFVVIDEAGGVNENLFTSVSSITTTGDSRILAIANPDDPSSYAAKIWHAQEKLPPEQRDWNLIKIPAFETPNFTGEKIPEHIKPYLLQTSWVEEARRAWGEDDPRWQAKVLANFPDISNDGLFNMGSVSQAMDRFNVENDNNEPLVLGVDVARYGADYTVISARRGRNVWIVDKFNNQNTVEVAKKVAAHATQLGAKQIRVDGIGIGVGVLDSLPMFTKTNVEILSLVGSSKSTNTSKWYNSRAQWYDNLSQLIKNNDIDIQKDEELYDECRGIKYEFRNTSMLIESKEAMRKRGMKSPDILDSIVYACADIYTPVEEEVSQVQLNTDSYMYLLDEDYKLEWEVAPA